MILPPLSISDFAAIFTAIHGVPPFPWQSRLVERLAAGDGWPQALDLPTGAGKTAAIDAALFHLALQADHGPKRQAPIRIAFVVDRRIIVDAAAARAEAISRALSEARGDGPLARMAARLRHLAGPRSSPLTVARMRGGLPREGDWARTPGQPTILCSTVDQVGSRLLFRGYGISDSMKPVHAGLLGADCLLLLDEAHLAAPFAQTLQRISGYRAPPWCEIAPGPWGFVSLSATQNTEEPRFSIDDADRDHPILKARLEAPKRAILRSLTVQSGSPEHAAEFVKAARAMLRPSQVRIIAIVVNRVALARAIFDGLSQDESDVILLTGRTRGIDRDALLARHGQALMTGAERGVRSLIIVATQTIEAGADFDFDALITQIAPLDSLRQRFGRLNRAGRATDTEAAIIATKDEVAARVSDPVYGDRAKKTWDWLLSRADKAPKKGEASLDFGIASMDRLLTLEPGKVSSLSCETPQAPILRTTDVGLLSWTSPIPAVDPAIEVFLHGPKAGPADVSLVWRADLTEATLDKAIDWIALVPPHVGETLSVPLWAARAWLGGNPKIAGETADLEGAPAASDDERANRRVLRWAGADSPSTGVITAAQMRPGDVVIVPASYGGCDGFGWNPASKAIVTDLGDQRGENQRATRRFHPVDARWASVSRLLAPEAGLDNGEVLAAMAKAGLIPEARGWRLLRPAFYPGAVLLGPKRDALSAATEEDALGSADVRPVTLADHSAQVAEKAEAFAQAAGMPGHISSDIRLAAMLHDAGKNDPRFQILLAGGDRLLAILNESEPLAKSNLELTRADAVQARRRAGLPERWRHEAQSVTRALADPVFAQAHDPELVIWLIGVHHGYGRPFFPHDDPREAPESPGPQRLDFQFRNQDWPQIFECLKARYGPWELARFEAVLRLADHRASEGESA
ncbi:MAG: type I-U CRISPR-associated helicase/endonuclease Cas3 [Alphaproteobacteria bacterium]